jgi:hypothetical protein
LFHSPTDFVKRTIHPDSSDMTLYEPFAVRVNRFRAAGVALLTTFSAIC